MSKQSVHALNNATTPPKVIIRTSQFPRELLEKAYREIQAKKAEMQQKNTGTG